MRKIAQACTYPTYSKGSPLPNCEGGRLVCAGSVDVEIARLDGVRARKVAVCTACVYFMHTTSDLRAHDITCNDYVPVHAVGSVDGPTAAPRLQEGHVPSFSHTTVLHFQWPVIGSGPTATAVGSIQTDGRGRATPLPHGNLRKRSLWPGSLQSSRERADLARSHRTRPRTSRDTHASIPRASPIGRSRHQVPI